MAYFGIGCRDNLGQKYGQLKKMKSKFQSVDKLGKKWFVYTLIFSSVLIIGR